MSGTLYIVATPIGNLEDITLRAVRILREVAVIAAEDTRHTRKLLSHLDIHTPMVSYHRHNAREQQARVLARLAHGEAVALVSDAGTPAIADPGAYLVAAARAADIPVVPIPGPSALATAWSVAGIITPELCFVGFLPEKSGRRRKLLETCAATGFPVVCYFARWDVKKYLTEIAAVWPGAHVTLLRELTKQFEEIIAAPIADAIARVSAREPKGEFVAIISGLTHADLASSA